MKRFVSQSEKKQKVYFLFTVLSLILLVGLVVLFPSIRFFISRAAGFTSLEAEAGATSQGVTLGADTTASNGQYVQFTGIGGSPTPGGPADLSFQPSAPYYGAFFYMWSKNPNTDNQWSYWTDNGNSPPTTWFSHYLPDPNPTTFDPANELYSGNNYDIWKWQVSKMAEAKLEFGIASWWGPGTREDTVFNNIINSFMGRADNPYKNLRWAVYYEDEGFADPDVATLVNDLTYIKSKYSQSPYVLKVSGKPVVFVYAGANDVPGTMTSRWKTANAQLGNYFYVVLKVFPGYQTDANQPDSWHQYAPAVRSGSQVPDAYFVSPGFWLDGTAERLARNPAEFETAVRAMVAANAKWKLVETWNEWGEGTSVEPGTPTKIDTSGHEVQDQAGYQFGNTYIDILNRNLPSLEKGSGSSGPTPSTPVATSTPNPTGGSAGDPVVVAVGDIVCGTGSSGAACKQAETANLAASTNPSAVFVLGDNQYENGTYQDFLNYYDKTWGRFKNITYPVVGNHEYITPNASGYFDYFNGVNIATGRAGDRTKGYYAVNIGSWRVYSLNSNCGVAGGCGVGSPQERWLRADLAANPKACAIALLHHPLWTSGSRANEGGDKTPLYQALYDFGAELILAGHEHNYERFAPQTPLGGADIVHGIREFVVGTGGRNFTQFVTTAQNSEAKNDSTFGVLKLTLHSNSYDYEFLPIQGSSYTDKGSSTCH